jgi:signal transduction histidine kinase
MVGKFKHYNIFRVADRVLRELKMENSLAHISGFLVLRKFLYRFRAPLIVFLVGLLLSIFTFFWVSNVEAKNINKAFQALAENRTKVLQKNLLSYQDKLIFLRGFVNTSDFFSEDEFNDYTQSLFDFVFLATYQENQFYKLTYDIGDVPENFDIDIMNDIDEFDGSESFLYGADKNGKDMLYILFSFSKDDGTSGSVIGAIYLETLFRQKEEWESFSKDLRIYLFRNRDLQKPFYHFDETLLSLTNAKSDEEKINYSLDALSDINQNHAKHKISFMNRDWSIVFLPTSDFLSNSKELFPWIILAFGIIVTTLLTHNVYQTVLENIRVAREVDRKTKELKISEEALQVSNKELESLSQNLAEKVEEKTKELFQTQENMFRLEKLSAIGKFASFLTHELRGPLSVIKNSASFIKIRLGQSQDQKIVKHLGIVDDEIYKSDSIITNTLGFVRTKELDKKITCLNTLLNSVIEEEIIPSFVKVKIDFCENVPSLPVNEELLKSAFRNIFKNAVQSIVEEGVVSVTTQYDTPSEMVIVSFEDTGCGISEEHQKKVFDVLFSTKVGGTGLGLSACENIIQSHKGEINLSSVQGEGTLITIKIPKT